METDCPGCGVRLPGSGHDPDRRLQASAECWQVYGEVVGFELNHLAQLGQYHQLTVDTYGAQHPGADPRGIRLAYSLVGLYLALDRRRSGLDVRRIHQGMGKPQPWWPAFERPADPGRITVLDVAKAGARADSVPGHGQALERWAAAVWAAWSGQHQAVTAFASGFLP